MIKGNHLSEKTKRKISKSLEGNTNPKGYKHSEEARKNMSKARIGNKSRLGIPNSEETKQKISEFNKGNTYCKGYKRTEETKKKISKALKGKNNPIYGKHLSEETRMKIRETKIGVKNYNWKGGTTSLQKIVRMNFKYRQWRSDVFTRDNFTCQRCGQIRKTLNAHHIKLLASILQKYKITTLEEALECEELWNINNGITLCEECHNRINK